MNMGVYISIQVTAFSYMGIEPELELLSLMVILCLVFKGTAILFSILAIPF